MKFTSGQSNSISGTRAVTGATTELLRFPTLFRCSPGWADGRISVVHLHVRRTLRSNVNGDTIVTVATPFGKFRGSLNLCSTLFLVSIHGVNCYHTQERHRHGDIHGRLRVRSTPQTSATPPNISRALLRAERVWREPCTRRPQPEVRDSRGAR
jgi:hypothetical protein